MGADDKRPDWPQCPPFPDFTDLERQVLEAIAEGVLASEQAAYRRQIAAAQVTSREFTGVGFYTTIGLDRSTCPPVPSLAGAPVGWTPFGGAHLEVEGVEHGLCITLWFSEGYFDCIEGVTYGEDGTLDPVLANLRITQLQVT